MNCQSLPACYHLPTPFLSSLSSSGSSFGTLAVLVSIAFPYQAVGFLRTHLVRPRSLLSNLIALRRSRAARWITDRASWRRPKSMQMPHLQLLQLLVRSDMHTGMTWETRTARRTRRDRQMKATESATARR